MKDILIDNNVAKNFATPLDPNYKELINWIVKYDHSQIKANPKTKKNYAHLVVNQKLLNEYLRTSRDCAKASSIPVIINKLTQQGRLIKMTKKQIENFKQGHFTKTIERKLLSNNEDHVHIVSTLLSERRMCLTYDDNLITDLNNFPKFRVDVAKRPEELGYQ